MHKIYGSQVWNDGKVVRETINSEIFILPLRNEVKMGIMLQAGCTCTA